MMATMAMSAEASAEATAAAIAMAELADANLTNQLAIAGANIATGNLATTIHVLVNIAQNIPTTVAADKFLSTTLNSAAVGYHSTTAKHAADIAHNTTIHAIANIAQNITTTVAANTFLNTTTNEYAHQPITLAAHPAHQVDALAEHAAGNINDKGITSPAVCDRQIINICLSF